MKHPFTIHFHLFLALALAAPSPAAVPLEWTARPGEIAPAQFTRHHGETLELRCRFAGFGELPFAQAADIRLWYQTNGMSSAWWSVPAQASSNTLSAVFAPQSDPGGDLVRLFFGAPSNVYASAVLRLRPSPGAAPNVLPPPEGFAEADPVFAAWLATDPFAGLAPADYDVVSHRAMSAVQPASMSAAITAAMSTTAERFIPIYGDRPIVTEVSLFFNREIYEQGMLQLMLPNGLNIPAVDFVSSAQITNAGAVAAAAANSAEQLTAATNAALAAAKYYADTAIAAALGQDASWNRPGEWTLAFYAIPTTPTIHAVEITTNDLTGVVISNATITESQTLSAHVYPVALDEMSPSSPPAVTLSCDEEGTAIDESVITAAADGVYTVRGTGTNGVTRSTSVAIYSSLTRQRTASAYIADTNAVRRDVHDQAAFITANCTYHEILDYPEIVGPGSFKAWETINPTWAWPGRGRENPWAIAPKVLMTATHYGWYYPTGEVTLRDNVGNTNFTIVISSSEYWPTLFEWAQANGYTAAETAIADMHDLRFGVIEQGYIPDACLPYLVDADELDALFGGSVEGVTAWFCPQGDSLTREDNHYPFCIPVVLGASDYRTERIRWTGPYNFTDTYPALVREDIREAVGKYDARNWFRIRPGDSGRPCFIRWGAYDIPISQAHTVDTGPSIPAAAKIIRHFCRAHGCEPKSLPANLIPSNQ